MPTEDQVSVGLKVMNIINRVNGALGAMFGILGAFDYVSLIYFMIFLSTIIFILLLAIPAGYGKMMSKSWEKFGTLSNTSGWFLMEFPTMFLLYFYYTGPNPKNVTSTVFLAVWLSHYVQRTFIFPFLLKGKKRMPVLIVLMGAIFNTINVYIQGKWLYYLASAEAYNISWLTSAPFLIGITTFLAGYVINRGSDKILRNLRKDPNDSNYYIPKGGMFEYVSAPNYLGEIMEWLGWAIMTWSTAGLVFFLWTFANLGPRALATHKWYMEKFGKEYDELGRNVLIPHVW